MYSRYKRRIDDSSPGRRKHSLIPRIDSKQLPAFGLIMLLLVAIPLTKFALDRNTHERSKAAGSSIPYRVEISPGQIITAPNAKPIYLSALVYDTTGEAIGNGVTYEWGFSTTISIGTLVPNGNLATFKPSANSGIGYLWVNARNANGTAQKSMMVNVGPVATPTPTPMPTATPTPIPERPPVISTSLLPNAKFKKVYNSSISGYDVDLIDNLSMTITGLPQGVIQGQCSQTKTDKVYLTCPLGGAPAQKGTFNVSVVLSDSRGGQALKTIPLVVR